MNQLIETSIGCPYCGEVIEVLIDSTDVEEQYIEDCQVCCRPINFSIFKDINCDVSVNVGSEDEAF